MTTTDPPPFSTGDPIPIMTPSHPLGILGAAYDVLAGELREVKARLDTLSALHADCMASCVCYQRGYRKGNEAMARTLMWEPKA